MSWLSRGLVERRAKQLTYDQIASLIDGGDGSAGRIAGLHVTPKLALQVSTVLSCVRVISEGCATPKLNVYRGGADGRREAATNIPEHRLLHSRPNEWQTSFDFRRMMTLHAALAGAGFAIKVRGLNRRVRELLCIPPGAWRANRVDRYTTTYTVADEWGVVGTFAADDVFILPGLQWQADAFLPAVSLARNIIGLSAASERAQLALMQHGMRPSGTYSVEGTLDDAQHKKLTAWLKNQDAGSPLVLDRGAKWNQITSTAADAQSVETRRMQVEEVCRAWGVFPVMVGHSDKASTFASTEAFFSAHLIHTLTPWHRNWTQRIDEFLLDGAGPLWAEFDTRYMTAGSMKDRALYARAMVETGLLNPNEWRDDEGRDPRPGGDEYLRPLNMTAGSAGTTGASDEPPAP
jgi:HK97 family phage portal protein